jgi:hypothetical protein
MGDWSGNIIMVRGYRGWWLGFIVVGVIGEIRDIV